MAKIKLLDVQTANKIAAGEVIINPASVIKELLENSIDAQSSAITIEIKKGGKELISIRDNGIGISSDDITLAFKRHATSKIYSVEDLEKINTLGFRGEALASIAAVSKIDMKTKERQVSTGIHISLHGGKVVLHKEMGCPTGTTIRVEDIFYNTPARYKYLKKESVESGYISSIIERIALSHPEISFRLISEERQIFHTPGNGDLFSCIYSLYGKEFASALMEVEYNNHPMKITGYIGKPELSRSSRKHQIFFVNHRYIKSRVLSQALEEAYKGLIMIHKFPVAILNVNLPSHMLDINVHPAKTEILFQNESLIYLLVKQAIHEHLVMKSLIPEVTLNDRKVKDEDKLERKDIQGEISFPSSLKEPSFYFNETEKVIKEQGNNEGSIYKKKPDYNIQINSKPRDAKLQEYITSVVKYDRHDIPSTSNQDNMKDTNQQQLLEELQFGKVIGQIFSTYIIVEIAQGLLLIDQHAAHERIAYNRLKEQYKNNKVTSQNLLIPINIDLAFQEYQLIKDFLPMLDKLGFDVKEFGNNSIILRSVPLILGRPQNEKHLLEIIDHLQELKEIDSSFEKEERLISMACKSAIKAHDRLDNKEITQLIKDLVYTEYPYTCPHGRPTIIRLTQYELEKLFKRIQ